MEYDFATPTPLLASHSSVPQFANLRSTEDAPKPKCSAFKDNGVFARFKLFLGLIFGLDGTVSSRRHTQEDDKVRDLISTVFKQYFISMVLLA
ncbi:hypothetical protein E2C01_001012 [Portunus trituberculatus]|uniref:Uncharacterized protein n=1 Tax=Portunus trituberculatus TaxID=210409 RepID=A0A5B7CJ55_PORTR|nr:hypothetical protein [Portunus trituberculatus]